MESCDFLNSTMPLFLRQRCKYICFYINCNMEIQDYLFLLIYTLMNFSYEKHCSYYTYLYYQVPPIPQ